MAHILLKYQLRKEGGRHPDYEELLFPTRHGPSLYIHELPTDKLFIHRSVCPSNSGLNVVDLVEDVGLRGLVLADKKI